MKVTRDQIPEQSQHHLRAARHFLSQRRHSNSISACEKTGHFKLLLPTNNVWFVVLIRMYAYHMLEYTPIYTRYEYAIEKYAMPQWRNMCGMMMSLYCAYVFIYIYIYIQATCTFIWIVWDVVWNVFGDSRRWEIETDNESWCDRYCSWYKTHIKIYGWVITISAPGPLLVEKPFVEYILEL